MKLLNIFGTIIVIVLIAIAIFAFVAPRFGWRVDTVLSGSMEPHLKVGGVVVTQPAEILDVRRGDIVTFYSPLNGKLTTHRAIDHVNGAYVGLRTKGDANEEVDPFTVSDAELVGKTFLYIPYFGYLTRFLKNDIGISLTLCLPGLIIVVTEIVKICRYNSRRRFDSRFARRRLERRYYY